MSRIIVFLFLIVSLGVKAQESEKYYWEGFKYQSKLKLEKATNAYLKAIKASENKSNINSRELYYLTFAHTEIAKIYSGASIFSNNSDNISAAYNSVKKIFEYYAILYQRNEESYIKDFERAKVLSIANESLKNILSLKPDLFPSNDKINNDTNSTLGIVITWKNNYLAIIEKYNSPNKSSEETYLKENDIILEITTANGINYYSIEDFIIANKNLGEGSDGDVFRVKLVRNGQIEYTQIKKYRKASTKDVTPPQSAELVNNKENQVVSLTVSGTGKTKEDAQKNALRSAIEQAFGAFVSSKTEILNDSIVKDEVVSITNGNIQKFEVVSEINLPNGNYAITMTATVSIGSLKSFALSKGVNIEYGGSLFAMNIKLQKLNEEAEFIAIKNLCEASKNILMKSIDYKLQVGDPKLAVNTNDKYELELFVDAAPNENYREWYAYFIKTLMKISATKEEVNSYINMRKSIYSIEMARIECASVWGATCEVFKLRNLKSYNLLIERMAEFQSILYSYRINSKIDTIIGDLPKYKSFNETECSFKSGLQYEIDNIISHSFPSALIYQGCGAGYCYRYNLACLQKVNENKEIPSAESLEILYNNKPIRFKIIYLVNSIGDLEKIDGFNIEPYYKY